MTIALIALGILILAVLVSLLPDFLRYLKLRWM
jgi:hypothetical protein